MIPFGNEQPRRPEEKGPFVLRLYIQGRHSVPRGRVAFVEIALPPNQQIRWHSAVSEVVEVSPSYYKQV